MKKQIGKNVPVVRAMPNTAIAVCESMTCICGDPCMLYFILCIIICSLINVPFS